MLNRHLKAWRGFFIGKIMKLDRFTEYQTLKGPKKYYFRYNPILKFKFLKIQWFIFRIMELIYNFPSVKSYGIKFGCNFHKQKNFHDKPEMLKVPLFLLLCQYSNYHFLKQSALILSTESYITTFKSKTMCKQFVACFIKYFYTPVMDIL